MLCYNLMHVYYYKKRIFSCGNEKIVVCCLKHCLYTMWFGFDTEKIPEKLNKDIFYSIMRINIY